MYEVFFLSDFKEDLAVCLTYFFMLHYTKIHVYTIITKPHRPRWHFIDCFVNLNVDFVDWKFDFWLV